MLVARAMVESGTNRKAVRDWLGDLNGPRAYTGVTSRAIQFDAGGDVPNGGFVMTQVQNGTLVTRANDAR
jgi:hypothetical protein